MKWLYRMLKRFRQNPVPPTLTGIATLGFHLGENDAVGIQVSDTRFQLNEWVYIKYITPKGHIRSDRVQIIGFTKVLPIVLTPALFKRLENPVRRKIPVTVWRST